MAFKQGVEPCIVVAKQERSQFRGALFSAGYKPHTGLRTRREGEIQAWVKPIGRGRQVHVQEVRLDNGDIEVFAHTEPEDALEHAISALTDGASFSGGAKVLLNHLREQGYDV